MPPSPGVDEHRKTLIFDLADALIRAAMAEDEIDELQAALHATDLRVREVEIEAEMLEGHLEAKAERLRSDLRHAIYWLSLVYEKGLAGPWNNAIGHAIKTLAASAAETTLEDKP